MIALRIDSDVDLELGEVLAEDFGKVADKQTLEQLDWLALLPSEEVAATIKARAVLAYRKALAQGLAEYLAQAVGE